MSDDVESGRVHPDGVGKDQICFASDEGETGVFFTFAPPCNRGERRERVAESNTWVREVSHIIACDNKESHYIRLNRQDALDLAVWLLNVARSMDKDGDDTL